MKDQKREKGAADVFSPPGKEPFFSRHVQGITFFIVIALFLTFFGPLNVFHLQKVFLSSTPAEGTKQMTVEEAIRLSEASGVTLSTLKTYAGTSAQTEGAERYSILFDDYLILAVFNRETKELSVYLADLETQDQCNFLQDDVAAFFAKQTPFV